MEITKEITDKDGKKKTVKEQAPNIGMILSRMEERGMFNEMKRYAYTGYDMAGAIALVEAIGKRRNPRFVIDDENRFAYENFICWCHGDAAMRALDPDTGKPVKGDLKRASTLQETREQASRGVLTSCRCIVGYGASR